jgi:RND family efflux transporter MFP subunit
MNRLGFWLSCAMSLAGGLTALAQAPKGGLPPATVVTAKVIEREEAIGQTFIGTLQPRRRSTVGSAVDGRVEQYPVNDGQWVKKGDVLAELLKETTKIELANAQAELRFRQAELDEYENKALPEDIKQAEAKLAAADAQLRYNKARYSRTESLFQRGTGITQEDMDLSYSNLLTAEQNQIGAAAALKLLQDWPRPEKLAQAQAHRDAQQESVNQIEDRLNKFTIRAPFDGYVVQKRTEVGAWINRGDPIAEVIEIDPIEVAVSVPETAIASLQEAMIQAEEGSGNLAAIVKVDALREKPFTGSVERIVPQADVRARTFPVKVLLENPPLGKAHKFKSGMICHVTLPVGKVEKVTVVPKDALVLGDETSVYVVDKGKDGTIARKVGVELGAGTFDNLIQVSGGIQPGQSVIIRGNERLIPGQPLNVVKEEK